MCASATTTAAATTCETLPRIDFNHFKYAVICVCSLVLFFSPVPLPECLDVFWWQEVEDARKKYSKYNLLDDYNHFLKTRSLFERLEKTMIVCCVYLFETILITGLFFLCFEKIQHRPFVPIVIHGLFLTNLYFLLMIVLVCAPNWTCWPHASSARRRARGWVSDTQRFHLSTTIPILVSCASAFLAFVLPGSLDACLLPFIFTFVNSCLTFPRKSDMPDFDRAAIAELAFFKPYRWKMYRKLDKASPLGEISARLRHIFSRTFLDEEGKDGNLVSGRTWTPWTETSDRLFREAIAIANSYSDLALTLGKFLAAFRLYWLPEDVKFKFLEISRRENSSKFRCARRDEYSIDGKWYVSFTRKQVENIFRLRRELNINDPPFELLEDIVSLQPNETLVFETNDNNNDDDQDEKKAIICTE